MYTFQPAEGREGTKPRHEHKHKIGVITILFTMGPTK